LIYIIALKNNTPQMNEKDREDFVLMKADVQHTKQDVEEIKDNSVRLNKEFDKLMFHLVGDKDTETKGWISKLTRFDFRLTILERAYAIGIGLITALILLKDKIM